VTEVSTLDHLIKMEIINLVKFSEKFKGIELHLKIGGKYIKLNYSTDHFIEILRKLQQKDVKEVYVVEADCDRIMESVASSLSSKNFYDPQTVQSKKVENLSAAMDTVKGVINQLGVRPETIKLLKTINERSMALLAESSSIFSFIKEFKKNCSEEFLFSVITNYLMSLVIDHFSWKSEQVKEKGSLASMLCDLTLSKEDFKLLRHWQQFGGELSDKIKNHPADIAKKLEHYKHLVPSEVITIVLQHHELPDGKGFPHGILGTHFNQLSTIFIICQRFNELLSENDYNYELRLGIIEKLNATYGSVKMFDKAINALTKVVA
jgi:hypothetical protein